VQSSIHIIANSFYVYMYILHDNILAEIVEISMASFTITWKYEWDNNKCNI
jgi:hypothetical protein